MRIPFPQPPNTKSKDNYPLLPDNEKACHVGAIKRPALPPHPLSNVEVLGICDFSIEADFLEGGVVGEVTSPSCRQSGCWNVRPRFPRSPWLPWRGPRVPDRSGVSGVPDCWQRLSWGWYRSSLSLGPPFHPCVWNADVAVLGSEVDCRGCLFG